LIIAPGDYIRWLGDEPGHRDLIPDAAVPCGADADVADIDADE